MHRARLIASAIAACLLAPAAARADVVLSTSPITVKAYAMTLYASDEKQGDSLLVTFTRQSGPAYQVHSYRFRKGVKVTRTSVSGSLGTFGSVKLRFRPSATQPASFPRGCAGTPGAARSGRLQGRFELKADRSYFRTVARRSLPAFAPGVDCTTPPPDDFPSLEPHMSHSQTKAGDVVGLYASPTRLTAGRLDDEARTAPASVQHLLTVKTVGLTAITETRANAIGLAPFITGAGFYSGKVILPGQRSSGRLSGTLSAAFDSIGPVRLRGSATLSPK